MPLIQEIQKQIAELREQVNKLDAHLSVLGRDHLDLRKQLGIELSGESVNSAKIPEGPTNLPPYPYR